MIDLNENTIDEQNNIPGQQKEVNVKDYPYTSELANLLKDIEQTADKSKILNFIQSIGNIDENLIQIVEKIDNKQYDNSADVITATGLVGKNG